MRKPLKSEFVEALGEAVAEYGSQSELARQSGVGQATINSILNDKNKREILDSIMDKLYPFVRKYLPGHVEMNVSGGSAYGIVHGDIRNGTEESGIPRDVLNAIMADKNLSPIEKDQMMKELMRK